MSLSAFVVTAAPEQHNDLAIPPIAVGAIALGILFGLMILLLIVGGGREHS
jgi:hypothetical protein